MLWYVQVSMWAGVTVIPLIQECTHKVNYCPYWDQLDWSSPKKYFFCCPPLFLKCWERSNDIWAIKRWQSLKNKSWKLLRNWLQKCAPIDLLTAFVKCFVNFNSESKECWIFPFTKAYEFLSCLGKVVYSFTGIGTSMSLYLQQ